MRAPLASNELERLQALDRCELLDTPPEEAYDRIVRVAAEIFSAPMAAVSLVSKDRQFFKSQLGMGVRETERDAAFCAHAILSDQPLVVLDATKDPRFSDNRFVTGYPGIRFYCGAPLTTPDGFPVGTLCVIDTEPRTSLPEQAIGLLRELAAQVSTEIAHRQESLRLARTSIALSERESELEREKQLRFDSEIRAQLALEAGNMGSWEWDARRGRAVLSPVMYRLFGYAAENPFPDDFDFIWLKRVHPEDRRSVANLIRGATDQRGVFSLEFRLAASSGNVRWLALRGSYMHGAGGKLERANGVCWDITERKRLEEERYASQELTRRIVESSADCIKILDLNGCLLSMRPNGQFTLGIENLRPLIGREYFQLWANEKDREMAKAAFGLAAAGGLGSFQAFFPGSNGEPRWWDTVFTPIVDQKGRPERVLAISRDMTELRQASKEQEQARELAEVANRAKSLFLANVSHELRTPLNGVLGMTELLLATQLNQEQQEIALMVQQSGSALLALVNDLLDLSRVESGKMDCKREPFDLKSTLRQSLSLFAPAARQKGLELKLDFPELRSDLFLGDEDRIRQIAVNYINNALKFTESGGVYVEVTAEPGADSLLDFTIAVRDTGKGITPEQQETLFAPFRQLDSSSTRKYGGLGLGLAISKRVAEVMSGSVGLRSTLGHGSTFWVKLPLKPFDKPATRSLLDECRAGQFAAAGTAQRVLVAEDNDINQKLVLRFLEKLGCIGGHSVRWRDSRSSL